jgi:predicted enzyme related to lactoylglutathione lyase
VGTTLTLEKVPDFRFFQYELRTTDTAGARTFYGGLFDIDFSITQLPEAAIARGARPHLLGHLGPSDIDTTAAQFLNAGGTQLGPRREIDVVIRDPFGAILALSPRSAEPDAVWHVHHGPDAIRSSAFYRQLLGRMPANTVFVDQQPGVHPQWLHFFRVAHLDTAIAYVRKQGGLPLEPTRIHSGQTFVPCDDPQGAAFGLYSEPGP